MNYWSFQAVLCLILLTCSYLFLSCSTDDNTNENNSIVENNENTNQQILKNDITGTFQISLKTAIENEKAYTSFFGKVFDGKTPSTTIWEEKNSIGECKLLIPRIPFCEQPCTSGSVCTEDNICQSYPGEINIGIIQLEGLQTISGETTINIEPVANNYQLVGVELEFPPFSERDDIILKAEGNLEVSSFTLTTKGITPLELKNDSIPIEQAKSVTLNWTPPSSNTKSKIYVKLDVSHHGGTKGKIECETEDSGSLVIAANLLKSLLDLGVAGFPTVILSRKVKDQIGQIEFTIVSTFEKLVTIDGVVSCFNDSDCPENQKCQSDRQCQ